MKNTYLKNGLLLGVILVIIASILHAIDPRLFLNWSSPIGYAVILFFMYKTAVEVRSEEGGLLPFGEAFIAALVPMVVGVFISSFYTYVLHNWVNPELTIIVKEIAIETTITVVEQMSNMFDMEVDLDEALLELENVDYSFGFGKMILGGLLTSLMGCIPALIIAAITKKGE